MNGLMGLPGLLPNDGDALMMQRGQSAWASPSPFVPRNRAGRWAAAALGSAATRTLVDGRLIFTPLFLTRPIAIDRVGVWITTVGAGSVIRLALYAGDGYGNPGTLVREFGTVPGTATGNIDLITSPLRLSPGYYWFAYAAQGGTPTVYGYSGNAWGALGQIGVSPDSLQSGAGTMAFYIDGYSAAFPYVAPSITLLGSNTVVTMTIAYRFAPWP